MKRNSYQKKWLTVGLILNLLVIIPLIRRKPPIKDWIIAYLSNAVTNVLIDNILTKSKVVRYPIRLLPKLFDIHLIFDLFFYPTFTIIYNQLTMKDTILPAFLKLILLTIPPFLIEVIAENKTDLIVWSKKWNWYHSFFTIILKSLMNRILIAFVRKSNF